MKGSSDFVRPLEPKRPEAPCDVPSVTSSIPFRASETIRTMPKPSLVSLEAGVGVPKNKAKRKHNPNKSDAACRIKKRRMTETNHHKDAIASINRLREARAQAIDPRVGMDLSL